MSPGDSRKELSCCETTLRICTKNKQTNKKESAQKKRRVTSVLENNRLKKKKKENNRLVMPVFSLKQSYIKTTHKCIMQLNVMV